MNMRIEKNAKIWPMTVWAVGLMGLWLILSGYLDPLLIGLGVLSCGLVMYLKQRIYKYGRDPVPIKFDIIPLTRYWLWLLKEVVVANIDVTKRILAIDMPLDPGVSKVSSGNLNEFGKVIYANSITLTPGTISINVGDSDITVHALSNHSLADLEQGAMRERIEQSDNATRAVEATREHQTPQF